MDLGAYEIQLASCAVGNTIFGYGFDLRHRSGDSIAAAKFQSGCLARFDCKSRLYDCSRIVCEFTGEGIKS
jgi:hypothetical protein